ncbi:hypothetical protein [Streptomyces sp. NPDC088739]|uniref:hypothetical protein n=1 Tax=Streptomyces sp. NPDC088739 TaxID=3365882 RepID=UPI0038134F1E
MTQPPETRPPLPAPPPAVGVLGCASQYQAAIFQRGGQRLFISAARIGVSLTAVEWERRLADTSVAQIVIAKRQLAPACCQDLGEITPWCHELAVYRDQALVWQGPILRAREEEAQITVDAVDVTGWLSRLVNTKSTLYLPQQPQRIAADIVRRNLLDASLATPGPDWPNLLPYLDVPPARPGIPVSVLRLASIWTDYVLTIVDNMADKGMEWTTVGRRLVMRQPVGATGRARARLVPEHLPGGVSVVRDGEDAATRVFATSQTDSEPGITVSVAAPRASATCGRLDLLVRENPRVEVENEDQKTARVEAIRKRREGREDAATNAYTACAKAARDRYDAAADAARDKFARDQKARRDAANKELKRIAALPDATCNRKCKDDTSDDERDDRDNTIQSYRVTRDNSLKALQRTRDTEVRACASVRDKAIQTARVQYDQELAASNAKIQKQIDDETRKILTALARQTLSGRWPVPTVVVVQPGARLSSEAPITVDGLVPGERIDVAAVGFCNPVARSMKLTTVNGSWTAEGEDIRISLTPLTPLPTEA